MPTFIKKIQDAVSGTRPKDLIYPGIIFLLFIVVSILFALATKFIAKNIDIAFSGDTGEGSSSLNMQNYTIVAKKLGISIDVKKETPITQLETVAQSEPTAVTTQVLDKKSITISILNSTSQIGIAGALAKSLGVAGFSMAKTGNEKTPYATTTVATKGSKSALDQSLLEEVRKTYPDAVSTTSPETALFDAIITIGAK